MKKKANKEPSFLEALTGLGEERGIAPDILFDAIEMALISAYKKNFNSAPNVRVLLDRKTGAYHVYAIKTVVEEVENPIMEISIDAARVINADYDLDDIVEIEVTPANFGRIAAQTAKQVVMQRVREAERENVFEAYTNREGDIVTGLIQRIEGRNVFMEIGNTEAILAQSEQIAGEEYTSGKRMKVYIIEVKRANKGPQIAVSRTHPGLLKKLFELEVPEIEEGIVEIKSVAREPGMRSKIAVYSEQEEVDAVGSCVGQKGVRVQAIVDELGTEKIDIVKWNKDSATYIANALSPAKVVSVAVNEEEKVSRVVVPDYQLSLAIGKEGQNARLAAKLTGWKIDIKCESEAENEVLDEGMDEYIVTSEDSFTAESE
ncbi:MAG: transcription termination/antitermination protein NusA [Selenomonadaceae bacterium]|nr:transcription termination/antitermination protein NusA [Selenomonadaceae bacterium]